MSEQERSPRGAAAVAGVAAAAAAVLSIERTTFRAATNGPVPHGFVTALSRFYYRTAGISDREWKFETSSAYGTVYGDPYYLRSRILLEQDGSSKHASGGRDRYCAPKYLVIVPYCILKYETRACECEIKYRTEIFNIRYNNIKCCDHSCHNHVLYTIT